MSRVIIKQKLAAVVAAILEELDRPGSIRGRGQGKPGEHGKCLSRSESQSTSMYVHKVRINLSFTFPVCSLSAGISAGPGMPGWSSSCPVAERRTSIPLRDSRPFSGFGFLLCFYYHVKV